VRGHIKTIIVIDKYIEYCVYALLFFIPISTALVEIFFTLGLLGFIARKILNPDFNFIKSRVNLFLLFFMLFSILSIVNSGTYLIKSVRALVFKWSEYFLIFLIIQDIFVNRKQIRNILAILMLGGGILSIDGITQAVSGIDFLRQRKVAIKIGPEFSGITASFHHHNDFAAYLVVVLAMAIALFFFFRNRKTGRCNF